MSRALSLQHVLTVISGGREVGRRGRGRREIGEERGREVGRRAGERGRGGEERQHMTTTVPCRGVSIIYIYNVHVHDVHYVYTCSTFTGVCVSVERVCVCVPVSGCEVIPERRGRREGGAGVGAGYCNARMYVCR